MGGTIDGVRQIFIESHRPCTMGQIVLEKDPDAYRADLIIDNVDKLNAIDNEMEQELLEKLRDLRTDDDIKVIVFRGRGENFSSGHDVEDIGSHHGWTHDEDWSEDESHGRPSQRQRMDHDDYVFWGDEGIMRTILKCKKATVAQVRGYCYGGGFAYTLPCDITIASENAVFAHPGYRYIGPLGDIPLFFQTIGIKETKELMLTGRQFTAQEADDWGFVNHVVADEDLEEAVDDMVATIAKQPKDAIAMGKSNFELAHDLLGTTTAAPYITHTWQTNIKYEDDEFNLFKERKDGGVKGAIQRRKDIFADSPLGQDED